MEKPKITILDSTRNFFIENTNERIYEYKENMWYGHPIIRNKAIIFNKEKYELKKNVIYVNNVNIYDIYKYAIIDNWFILNTPEYYRMKNICQYTYNKKTTQSGIKSMTPLIEYIIYKLILNIKDDIDHLMFKRVKIDYKESFNLSNRSLVDAYTHLRKIRLDLDPNNKLVNIRDVHPSFKGFVCISDTPDNKNVGMIKTLAKNAFISNEFNKEDISHLKSQITQISKKNSILVFYNSECLGFIDSLEDHKELCISYLPYTSFTNIKIAIITDTPGRYMRIFADGKIKFVGEVTKEDIKSLDVYDLLSPAGNLIPYVNHNQSARITFAINMQKQAISREYDLYEESSINNITEKWYIPTCEAPMIKAPMTDFFPYNGINLKCKIAFYDKLNIEDAIVMSDKAAGKFTSYRLGVMKESYRQIFKFSLDEKYDDDGVIKVGSQVEKGDILAKIYEPSDIKNILSIKSKFSGEVIDVVKDKRMLIIRIKEKRLVRVGDKFTSRYGQKGVVGKIVPHEELYKVFKEEVDIVINPCAIPSRMTIGQLMEMNETNGYCYYQSLRHHVIDKAYSVAQTSQSYFSHSSVSGKSQGGGFRFGEMEKDCLIAYKAEKYLKEIFIDNADVYSVYVCKDCEYNIAYSNNYPGPCRICKGNNIKEMKIPYSSKLSAMALINSNILLSINK